ncbi:MAG: asparagine synthase (glutamine-hydrolysing) [Microgenomates group bacterium Gr01-1014_7]|nr:MAG: asparagine synthase (glutamine-hydrolysing) [Microgenomates group bacterium Gr01-1014_7]
MCGIVGYGGFTRKVSLDKALTTIKHRGPDGNGTEYFEDVALGNTRLAILDLSEKGHQPMFNKDRSLCITFNGEIYNFLEVKKLLDHKYKFRSNSDTEVILYAYQEWGFKCLEKLEGMFSFVIYDRGKKLLFGARDRLGQKPLKYYFDNGKLIFASEIKAILKLLDDKPGLDNIAIDNFLTLQYIPTPATGFKKLYKLPPGHYFIYKGKKLSIKRYWSLNFSKKLVLSTEEWQNLVFNEIKRAVQSHLVSDVPVGALLSGGLDSSIIVALMSLNSSKRVSTFNIGFDNDKFDESPYAKIVSKLYKTEHTELNITSADLINNLKKIAEVYDEPIGDNSILPTLLVSKLVSKKVKVALTGDGGDENFAGYDRYAIVNIASFIEKSPPIFKKVAHLNAKTAFQLHPSKLTERINRFFSSLDDQFYRKYVNYNSFFSSVTKHTLYSDEFNESIGDNDSYENYSNYFDEKLSDLDNALRIDIQTYLPDDLLYKTDTASMAYGLELRSPFLDHSLMEKMAAMPSQMKIKLLTKKKILKEIALKNNLLPKEIINRPKHGFIIPLNRWFKGSLKKYIYDTILSSSIIEKIFDKNRIENYLDSYYKTNLNYDNNIFALLTLALWVDKYHK